MVHLATEAFRHPVYREVSSTGARSPAGREIASTRHQSHLREAQLGDGSLSGEDAARGPVEVAVAHTHFSL